MITGNISELGRRGRIAAREVWSLRERLCRILREDGYCLNSTECHGIWGRNIGGKGRVRKDYVRLCEVDF